MELQVETNGLEAAFCSRSSSGLYSRSRVTMAEPVKCYRNTAEASLAGYVYPIDQLSQKTYCVRRFFKNIISSYKKENRSDFES